MNALTLDILLETPPDGPAIEKLHERAFGPGLNTLVLGDIANALPVRRRPDTSLD